MIDKKDLSGDILLKDNVVASFVKGELTCLDKEKAPYLINRSKDLSLWLESRMMDDSRVNSRILKRILGLSSLAGIESVLFVNAASVTDRYWFRDAKTPGLKYDDVRIKTDAFFDVSLNGNPNGFTLKPEPTGDLTTTGSFEKGWHIENGHWYLYKKGTPEELFSEKFIQEIGKCLGFDMAEYEICGKYIKSRSFAEELNLEHISSLVDDDESYLRCYKALCELGEPSLTEDYLRMLWLDTMCFNMDRHTGNIGILRDDQGKAIKLAPNYDNNIALISKGCVSDAQAVLKIFSDLYEELVCSDCKIAESFLKIVPDPVSQSVIDKAIDSAGGVPGGYKKSDVNSIVLAGQKYLTNLQNA